MPDLLPTNKTITPAEVLESVRGAMLMVLDELDNIGGEYADLCRYQELADSCTAFASVTFEPPTDVELPTDNPRLAWFDFPVIHGPTIRVLAFVAKEAPAEEGR